MRKSCSSTIVSECIRDTSIDALTISQNITVYEMCNAWKKQKNNYTAATIKDITDYLKLDENKCSLLDSILILKAVTKLL